MTGRDHKDKFPCYINDLTISSCPDYGDVDLHINTIPDIDDQSLDPKKKKFNQVEKNFALYIRFSDTNE